MKRSLIRWIHSDKYRMGALKAARNLNLPDWCLAAGFVRNLVWDKLHHYQQATQLNDFDLIYFDLEAISEEKDRALESSLCKHSELPWSVKNQARMHHRNNDLAYQSTQDAMRYWPEIETAVGARLNQNNDIEIIAPFGLYALFNNTITINPLKPKPEIFKQRVKNKAWLTRWPQLSVVL